MKATLRLNFEIDTADRNKEFLRASHLTARSIQPLSKSHKRKGSRRKPKPPSLIKRILEAIALIPSNVLLAFFAALFTTLLALATK